ncbi:hypothetical protein H1Q59_07390 [Holosporaceae bacterium 'Namur']|nr:hypothetical protein [Holosporaceae bacterium 'Namur']
MLSSEQSLPTGSSSSYSDGKNINHNSFFSEEEANKFSDTVIFISNSELDGFREGDGDLMDKLAEMLNNKGIKTIRIIENTNNVPKDKQFLLEKGELITLGNATDLSLKDRQKKLLEILDNNYNGKNKIFYIGSRFDDIDYDKEQPIRGGSGSLFTQECIKELQTRNIKIVINCLEYKFFKRSIEHLPKAVEMMKQQLFLADKIHFLTLHDKSNYEKTINQLMEKNFLVKAHYKVPAEEVALIQKHIKFEENLGNRDWLESQKTKGVHIPGIYTVSPLVDKDILKNSDHSTSPDKIINILANRENNILCFGIIRGAKGITEAVELSKLMRDNTDEKKVIIIGKLLSSFVLFKGSIIRKIFGIKDKIFNIIAKEVSEDIAEEKKHIEGNEKEQVLDFNAYGITYDNIIPEFFKNDYVKTNEFCQRLFDGLVNEIYPKSSVLRERLNCKQKARNIEIYLNISEIEVKKKGMRCKYAMKLDHKGMADNASTIVSCLGLYLPTFTASGVVTGNEFRAQEHRVKKSSDEVFPNKYQNAVIMPQKEYLAKKNKFTEIVPKNFLIEKVYEKINEETTETYIERLRTIRELYDEKVFNIDNMVQRLIKEILLPLNQPVEYQSPTSSPYKRPSSIDPSRFKSGSSSPSFSQSP